jgi:hypothetical protein
MSRSNSENSKVSSKSSSKASSKASSTFSNISERVKGKMKNISKNFEKDIKDSTELRSKSNKKNTEIMDNIRKERRNADCRKLERFNEMMSNKPKRK